MKVTRRIFGFTALAGLAVAGGYFGVKRFMRIAPHHRDIAYGSDPRQVLDIYLPEGQGPFPAVMEIHGGAFLMGDKAANPVQSELLAAGIAIVRINYRLSGTALWPAQGEDCLMAMDYLRNNAAKFGLDRSKIAIWGQSAGAFLAVSTAISLAKLGKPAAGVVNFYGPMDFSTMDSDMEALGLTAAMGKTSTADSPESQLLGFDISTDPERARAVGPIAQIEGVSLALPPLMIRHGDADTFIAHRQSQRLADAWAAADPTALMDFALVAGAGHGTSEFQAAGVVTPLVGFLTSVLKG